MRLRRLHPWGELTPREAIALQKKLADQVEAKPPLEDYRLVAGVDCSYSRFSPWFFAAVVLWDRRDDRVVEVAEAAGKSPFPYIPGLLSFREAPIVLEAFARLRRRPDVVMYDGQGRAHPRRFGIACHVGLFVDVPTLGCAKSRLVGEHAEPGTERGASVPLTDRGEVIGSVLRTRDRVKPLYVSIGHRLDLASAVRVVLECGRGYRQPEPTRLAHHYVNELRRRRSESREEM